MAGEVRLLAAVFAGGSVGAVARAALAEALPAGTAAWPWATLLVNVAGAFALGWVATRLPPASAARSLLGPGVCGALTTFSTLQLELLEMLDHGEIVRACAYAAVSVAAGLAAVAAAVALARRGAEAA